MLQTILATLQPMLMLFIFIALGYIFVKSKILPEDSSKAFSKLLTYAVFPALSFSSMATNFTVSNLTTHFVNLILGGVSAGIAVVISISIVGFFVKDKNAYERKVYTYALTFGNNGYVGDPVVLALFGLKGLAYYKIAILAYSILIYTWGINLLVPQGNEKKSFVKSFFNAPTVALLIGMVVGITGLGNILYNTASLSFITNCLSGLGNCMGPIAMLIAGITIARFNFKKMLTNKKVYVATAFRLILIPSVIIGLMFGVITLVNLIFNLSISNQVLFLIFFAVATPLGMNTIVYPESYGGDPSTGASMTMISHTLCVITIPLMYALLVLLFGPAPVF